MATALIIAALWFNNTTVFTKNATEKPIRLLAHRGVHQNYAGNDRSNDSCQASPIEKSDHNYMENTLASLRAAFDYGADAVEIDIHLTTDDVFAIYHDWRLECKTNGTGVTSKSSYDYLRGLDVAYNYSVDGVSFPFRGSGVGKITTLTEVL